jgi:3-hydroxy-3-methylglutaryl CoA synthase
MAAWAALDASKCTTEIDALFFASTTAPYEEKQLDAAINRYVSTRISLEEMVNWYGI